MSDIPNQATPEDEDLQPVWRRGQYQHQTMTLHNTVGLVFMSIFAFALLIALVRQQRRYQELAVHLAKKSE
jgi:hypothetical protein